MFIVTSETRGVPTSCLLRIGGYDGSYARCRATKDWCIIVKEDRVPPSVIGAEIKALECPFDKHDVIQIEYRKQKDG